MNKITTITYNYGFEYKTVRYVWKDKKLFRLPYCSNNRNYGFKEIPKYCFKSTTVYNIQKTKLTLKRLESLTQKVDWSHDLIEATDCPF